MNENLFSKRYGYSKPIEADIEIRDDAPHEFRGVLIQLAYECGLSPKPLRKIVCRILRKRPDSNNWSEFPNIDHEIHQLIDDCPWYKVYDVVEGIVMQMKELPYSYSLERFQSELNEYFIENGIGWQLNNDKIEIRGPEAFEDIVHTAQATLKSSGKGTAANELREALNDLSRRPDPDITGAIQHSMASLECIARDICNDKKATLGEILKRYKDIIPPPLNDAVKKAWGFSSEMARHIQEGRQPEFHEAELIVGICASVGNYLIKKSKEQSNGKSIF